MNVYILLEVRKIEYFKKYLTNPMVYILLVGFLLLTNSITFYFLINKEEMNQISCPECLEINEEMVLTEKEIPISKIKVDIKGYVKKPGVYELEEGAIVNDLVTLAGGIKSGGTTENINLSKKLNNEDVIIILTKTELKNATQINTSSNEGIKETKEEKNKDYIVNSNSNTLISDALITDKRDENGANGNNLTKKLVSINTAIKEELMTVSGIGEAKADAIIAYRKEQPFTNIEQIKNVSGIGDALFEKIKDYITI